MHPPCNKSHRVLASLVALNSSHNAESVTSETQISPEPVWRGEVLYQRTCRNSGKFATRTLLSQAHFQKSMGTYDTKHPLQDSLVSDRQWQPRCKVTVPLMLTA